MKEKIIQKPIEGFNREDRGRILERKFAPEAKNIPIAELQKATHPFIFGKVIDLIKKYQPEGWNPSDPSPEFMLGRDFHYFLFEELKNNGWVEDDISNVKLYTALGSYLDKHNNTDLVVEYLDKELGDNIYFTIDLKAATDKGLERLTMQDGESFAKIMRNEADFILNIGSRLIEKTGDKEDDKIKEKKLYGVLERKAKEMVNSLREKRKYLIAKKRS